MIIMLVSDCCSGTNITGPYLVLLVRPALERDDMSLTGSGEEL